MNTIKELIDGVIFASKNSKIFTAMKINHIFVVSERFSVYAEGGGCSDRYSVILSKRISDNEEKKCFAVENETICGGALKVNPPPKPVY